MQKQQAETPRQRAARQRREADETRDRDAILADAHAVYEPTFVGRETLNGHPVIVVSLKARPDARVTTREGGWLKQTAGKMWISEADHSIARLHVQTIDRVSIGWGVVARVEPGSSFDYVRTRVGDAWLPSELTVEGSGARCSSGDSRSRPSQPTRGISPTRRRATDALTPVQPAPYNQRLCLRRHPAPRPGDARTPVRRRLRRGGGAPHEPGDRADFPQRGARADRRPSIPYREVEIQRADGAHQFGWVMPASGADIWVLFLHGNASTIASRMNVAHVERLHGLGVNVFAPEYRGFNGLPGVPTEASVDRRCARGLRLSSQSAARHAGSAGDLRLVARCGGRGESRVAGGRADGDPRRRTRIDRRHRPAALSDVSRSAGSSAIHSTRFSTSRRSARRCSSCTARKIRSCRSPRASGCSRRRRRPRSSWRSEAGTSSRARPIATCSTRRCGKRCSLPSTPPVTASSR